MSTEEQDRILGQLIRERREAAQEIAAIDAKLQALTQSIISFACGTRDFMRERNAKPAPTIADLIRMGSAVAPTEEVVSLLRELGAALERKRDLDARLSDFGV